METGTAIAGTEKRKQMLYDSAERINRILSEYTETATLPPEEDARRILRSMTYHMLYEVFDPDRARRKLRLDDNECGADIHLDDTRSYIDFTRGWANGTVTVRISDIEDVLDMRWKLIRNYLKEKASGIIEEAGFTFREETYNYEDRDDMGESVLLHAEYLVNGNPVAVSRGMGIDAIFREIAKEMAYEA